MFQLKFQPQSHILELALVHLDGQEFILGSQLDTGNTLSLRPPILNILPEALLFP